MGLEKDQESLFKGLDSPTTSLNSVAQENELRLCTALSDSPLGIVIAHIDQNLRYIYIHSPHPDFNQEDILGKRDDEIAINEGTLRLVELKKEVIETGDRRRETITFPLSDGFLKYDVTIEPRFDDYGVVVGATSVSIDITNYKSTEEDLNRLYKQAEKAALSDELTGIANRRMFNQVLDIEWSHAKRNASPLSLIMIDVDNFKLFNDLHGHLRGDDCLKQIAMALNDIPKRAVDLVGRYGGEEFFVLLPNTGNKQAIQVAEQCVSAVRQLSIYAGEPKDGSIVTISAGVSTIIPSEDQHQSSLIEASDDLLYQAKRSGRNQLKYRIS